MQGKKYYQPKLYTTFNLADKIPDNNFYKCLKQVIDLEFLRKDTRKYYGKCGQKSIDPVVFFKLTLAGYLENINSDRKLIEHCAMRLDIRYFLDYDIDEELPWHSTLSRTRQLYGQEIFRKIFKMVLTLCINKGMVAGKRQAIDSALIKANASLESLVKKEILNDVDAYCQEFQEEEDQQSDKITSTDRSEEKHKIGEFHDGKNRNNQTYFSKTDPDAKISYKPCKPLNLYYLSQVSVDTSNHVITHIQADFADKKDSQCLPEVLNGTIENLSSNDLPLEEIICDGNYSSADALKDLEKRGISGFIPNFGKYKYTREGFTYNEIGDYYTCSQGKILRFKRIIHTAQRNYSKEYRSSAKDCKHCPLRLTCIGKSTQKQIRHTIDKSYFDKMHEKMNTPYAGYLKKLRQSTVEPVIGTLLEYGGLKKIRTKGINQANKCMIMAATVYNLKKWFKYVKKEVNTSVKVVSDQFLKLINFTRYKYFVINLNIIQIPHF